MCILDIQGPLFESQGQNSSTKHDGSAHFLHGCQIPAVKMTGPPPKIKTIFAPYT